MRPHLEPHGLRQLASFIVREMRWKAAAALAYLLLGSMTEGVSVMLLIPILEIAGAGHTLNFLGLHFFPHLSHTEFALFLLGFVIVIALRGLLMRAKERAMVLVILETVSRLRVALFAAIAFARWGFIATLRASDLEHALTAEANRVQVTIFQLFVAVQATAMLAVYGGISLAVSPLMTLFAATFGLVLFAIMRPVRRATASHGRLFTQQYQNQHRVLSSFIATIKTAKSFNAEPEFIVKFQAELNIANQSNLRLTRVTSEGVLISQVMITASMAGFSYVGLVYEHLAVSTLAILLFAFMRMAPRISALQDAFHMIILNLPAYETMRQLEHRCGAAQEIVADASSSPVKLTKSICFDHVSFSYAGPDDGSGRQSLVNASFKIPALQIIALVGSSGAGKSTLADLLLGLIEPASGRIVIDDMPLTAVNRRAWRNAVAYVPQDLVLMHDTIAANLRLANPDADETDIWAALAAAGAEEFVRATPEGLQTIVGERGLRLSGGERQRIALARALLRQPSLLILDEGTSALDWENQALVARSIAQLRGHMTVVTIAHRPSMITVADWVVVLEAGRVVEAGTYADIIDRPESHLRRIVTAEAIV